MQVEVYEFPVGYPGFLVSVPPVVSLAPARLAAVARAKMRSVRFFTTHIGGVAYLFEPWLTAFVEYDRHAVLAGVYRTEPAGEAVVGEPELVCLRRSEWSLERDLVQAVEAADIHEYAASGPQVDERHAYGPPSAYQDAMAATRDLVAALAAGTTVASTPPRPAHPWAHIEVQVDDDEYPTVLSYAPVQVKCESLEAALPDWLDRVGAAGEHSARQPDGPPVLAIQHSVPEQIHRR